MKSNPLNSQQGFTLLEILVTIIVLAIGLLGVAALQNTSVALSYESYLRTQGQLIANDLADRVRVNKSIDYDFVSTSTASTKPCEATRNMPCNNPVDMKNFDLIEASERFQSLIPDSTITIVDGSSGVLTNIRPLTITVTWDDRYDKDDDKDPVTGLNNDKHNSFTYNYEL